MLNSRMKPVNFAIFCQSSARSFVSPVACVGPAFILFWTRGYYSVLKLESCSQNANSASQHHSVTKSFWHCNSNIAAEPTVGRCTVQVTVFLSVSTTRGKRVPSLACELRDEKLTCYVEIFSNLYRIRW